MCINIVISILQMTIHGIEILANEERHLTPDEVREFYSHLQNEVEISLCIYDSAQLNIFRCTIYIMDTIQF